MNIASITANDDGTLTVVRDDGVTGMFDVRPYFALEAFEPLRSPTQFAKVRSGGYFVEWEVRRRPLGRHHRREGDLGRDGAPGQLKRCHRGDGGKAKQYWFKPPAELRWVLLQSR